MVPKPHSVLFNDDTISKLMQGIMDEGKCGEFLGHTLQGSPAEVSSSHSAGKPS